MEIDQSQAKLQACVSALCMMVGARIRSLLTNGLRESGCGRLKGTYTWKSLIAPRLHPSIFSCRAASLCVPPVLAPARWRWQRAPLRRRHRSPLRAVRLQARRRLRAGWPRRWVRCPLRWPTPSLRQAPPPTSWATSSTNSTRLSTTTTTTSSAWTKKKWLHLQRTLPRIPGKLKCQAWWASPQLLRLRT